MRDAFKSWITLIDEEIQKKKAEDDIDTAYQVRIARWLQRKGEA
jgi:hypothetical protein